MFFQNRSPRSFFEGPSAELLQKVAFVVPSSIFMDFKKAPFGPPYRPSNRKKRSTPDDPGSTSRDPAFHETMAITVPFGPGV